MLSSVAALLTRRMEGGVSEEVVGGSAPFCPCRLLNLSPISGRLVCRSRILMRKASSALDEIMTFSMYESVEPLYLARERRSDTVG